MIDWLKLRLCIPAAGKIPGDVVSISSPDGELKWQKVRPAQMRGSFDSSVQVSSCPVTGNLVVDGNPAKFFQGHNVFGSSDIHGLAIALAKHAIKAINIDVTSEQLAAIEAGQMQVARVDITEMYATGSLLIARASVRAVAALATMRHRGRAQMKEGTAYFGRHSRRSSLKVYAKGDELKDHPIPKGLPMGDEIAAFAADKLRFEVVLRTMELKALHLDDLSNWTSVTGDTLHREYIGRVNLPENIELPPAALEGLPARLKLAYMAWLRGDDLRLTLPRMTFYRYRQALLPHGIDLVALRPKDAATNVFPLRRVVELRPAGVPEWAIGTSAYFEPPRRSA